MNTGKGKMEEVEAALKQLLAGRVWSASLGRELESKRICLSDLLLDKQRKNVIKPADVPLIRQALGELQKNFQEEVKRVLLTEPELSQSILCNYNIIVVAFTTADQAPQPWIGPMPGEGPGNFGQL